MSQKKSKATRRSISVLKQIVSGILLGWKIAEFAANEKIKARESSYWCSGWAKHRQRKAAPRKNER